MEWLSQWNWLEHWTRAMVRASLYGGFAIAGTWMLCRLIQRISPGIRSWIWRLVYLKIVLLIVWPQPIALGWVPTLPVRLETIQSVTSSERFRPTARAEAENFAAPTPVDDRLERSVPPTISLKISVAFALWAAGVVLIGIRTGKSVFATLAALRRATPITDLRLCSPCKELSRALKLTRTPRLLSDLNVDGPQAAGLVKPVILFPVGFATRFSDQQIRLVLAHELGHIKRRDLLWSCLRHLVHAIFFFHPLVWVAGRQASLADEVACDDAALLNGAGGVSEYAATLLKVAEQTMRVPRDRAVLLGAGMSRAFRMLEARLEKLRQLTPAERRAHQSRRWRTALILAGMAGLLFFTGFFDLFDRSGIRQLDPRYPVLGFKVSRGRSHTISVRQEVCQIAGFKLESASDQAKSDPLQGFRASVITGVPTDNSSPGLPMRVAGWLRKLGLKPDVRVTAYSSNVAVSEDSCAFIVRFAHDPDRGGYEHIEAILMDDQGESIRLPLYRTHLETQSAECVKFWLVSPAPTVAGRFTLRLRLSTEARDIAVLRLGEI